MADSHEMSTILRIWAYLSDKCLKLNIGGALGSLCILHKQIYLKMCTFNILGCIFYLIEALKGICIKYEST